MSRWVPVNWDVPLHEFYCLNRWINLDHVTDMIPLIEGGTILVFADLSSLAVKESAEELLKLTGA